MNILLHDGIGTEQLISDDVAKIDADAAKTYNHYVERLAMWDNWADQINNLVYLLKHPCSRAAKNTSPVQCLCRYEHRYPFTKIQGGDSAGRARGIGLETGARTARNSICRTRGTHSGSAGRGNARFYTRIGYGRGARRRPGFRVFDYRPRPGQIINFETGKIKKTQLKRPSPSPAPIIFPIEAAADAARIVVQ